ncbi:MAG: Ig-like domain-containing protein [Chloroflexota bacterium]
MNYRITIIATIIGLALSLLIPLTAVLADVPIANDDNIAVNEGATATLLVGGDDSVLDNDSDPIITHTLSISSIVTTPNHATAFILNPNGTFSYKHNDSENFSDSFVYEVCDDDAVPACATATVNIAITAVNDNNPSISNQTFSVNENSGVGTAVGTVAASDSDVGDTLTFSATGGTGFTAFALATDGDITVADPAQLDRETTPSFTLFVQVQDSALNTSSATMTINLDDINEPPTANDDVGATNEDSQLTVNSPGVLQNDTDPEGDSLRVTTSSNVSANGAIVNVTENFPGNGSYSYNPTAAAAIQALGAGEVLTDTFTYTASDNISGSDNATVSIVVTGQNDTPTFTSNPITAINEDDVYTYNVVTTDIDATDMVSLTVTTKPAWLTVNHTGSGTATLSGTPTNDDVGIHNVSIKAQDLSGAMATQSFTIQVINVNDAPILDNAGNMTLPNIDEDNQLSNGDLVASIIASAGGDRITDPDIGSAEGIAVTGADDANGFWQYSTNNGASWSDFGSVSSGSAVLLNNIARIRFVPLLDYSGSAGNITFRAWDRTSGSNGATGVNTNTNGGSTAFSTATETATLTVNAINDAPVLDNSGIMILPDINEDNITSLGEKVSNIILSAGGDRITDADVGAVEGIAVIGLNTTGGDWEYSTNGGGSWTPFGSVSNSKATLLNTNARIRFVPNPDFNGPSGNVTFRAWDRTSGSNGSTGVNVSNNGGITAFSAATETAALTVISINDIPEIDLNGLLILDTGFESTFTSNGGPVSIVSPDISVVDRDHITLTKTIVTITNAWDGAAESLAVSTAGTDITADYNSSSNALTLSGVDTLANYQQVLGTITYNNTAQDPDDRQRTVQFVLNDSIDDSLPAIALVNIMKPHIVLELTPATQTIGSGLEAVFDVAITNDGNVDLTELETFSSIDDCAKDFQTLDMTETKRFSCTMLNVTETFNHVMTATALDPLGGTVTDNATVSVIVVNPNISASVAVVTPTVAEGGIAIFQVAVRNPSDFVTLNNVTVTNDIVTNCDREIGTLAPNDNHSYTCTAPNVEAAFTNELTATGENASNGVEVNDVFFFSVDVLALDLSITPNPNEIFETGEVVDFTVEVLNESSKEVTLTSLTTDTFGDITILPNSDCATGESLNANDGIYTCVFSTTVFGPPPTYSVELTAEAEDDTAVSVTESATASLTVIGVASDIGVSVTADPETVVGPGQVVTYTVRIENESELRDVTITTLQDSLLGPLTDLDGDCTMPVNGIEIATQASFECTYQAPFMARAGEKENHVVTAVGVDQDNSAVSGSAKVEVRSFVLYQPIVPHNFRTNDEPNNVCGDAFPLYTNTPYSFHANDTDDWYVFELKEAGDLTVSVTNFAPQHGQTVVYSWDGINCEQPALGGSRIGIGSTGAVGPDKTVVLGNQPAGHYLIRVINDGAKNTGMKYNLTIEFQ